MIETSFIIPSYNSSKTIKYTIESILKQNLFEQITDIIIVDSSDDDSTQDLLRSIKNEKIKLIFLPKKTSPSEGRNIGFEHSKGGLLSFIDSDVYLSETWLENVIKAYDKGCRVGAGSVSIPHFQINNKLALAQLYLQFNESLEVGDTRKVVMVPSCNMFVDRQIFQETGGFPIIRASEDVLLCLKIGKTNPIWFVPQAKSFHIFREEKQSYYRNQIILGKYIIIYRRNSFNKWFYKGVWPVLLLPLFLLIKLTRIKLRIFNAGWKHYKKFIISSPLFMVGLFYWAVGFLQGCLHKEKA